MHFFVLIIRLVIFVAFWTAVYANTTTIAGLNLQQTLNYVILAQLFFPTVSDSAIYYFGNLLTNGQMGIELLRPVDFQLATYTRTMAFIFLALILQIPIGIIGWFLYHYQLPTDIRIWIAFFITLILGTGLLFFFDWIISCLAFYTTEIWGLSVLRFGVTTFFSGSLIPLDMMPDWLRNLAAALPFSQALYVPVSLLSGITPLANMPRIWLTQIIYLVVLALISRWVFNVSVRKITIQGG
jgi:ABC-2 type transport system permease protein